MRRGLYLPPTNPPTPFPPAPGGGGWGATRLPFGGASFCPRTAGPWASAPAWGTGTKTVPPGGGETRDRSWRRREQEVTLARVRPSGPKDQGRDPLHTIGVVARIP